MAGGGGENEPNLTPFIDLFSVLICFLLMTAAWIQLESVQVRIEEKPKVNPDQAAEPQPPPPEKPEKKVALSLHLERDRIIAREDEKEKELALRDKQIGSSELADLLGEWKRRLPPDQVLVLHSGQKATYGQLIHLYDVVTHAGWSNVAINPY